MIPIPPTQFSSDIPVNLDSRQLAFESTKTSGGAKVDSALVQQTLAQETTSVAIVILPAIIKCWFVPYYQLVRLKVDQNSLLKGPHGKFTTRIWYQ